MSISILVADTAVLVLILAICAAIVGLTHLLHFDWGVPGLAGWPIRPLAMVLILAGFGGAGIGLYGLNLRTYYQLAKPCFNPHSAPHNCTTTIETTISGSTRESHYKGISYWRLRFNDGVPSANFGIGLFTAAAIQPGQQVQVQLWQGKVAVLQLADRQIPSQDTGTGWPAGFALALFLITLGAGILDAHRRLDRLHQALD